MSQVVVAVRDDRAHVVDAPEGVPGQALERDVGSARKMLLLELAFRENFEQKSAVLLNEPLDLGGVDLGRHPTMLVRFRRVAQSMMERFTPTTCSLKFMRSLTVVRSTPPSQAPSCSSGSSAQPPPRCSYRVPGNRLPVLASYEGG